MWLVPFSTVCGKPTANQPACLMTYFRLQNCPQMTETRTCFPVKMDYSTFLLLSGTLLLWSSETSVHVGPENTFGRAVSAEVFRRNFGQPHVCLGLPGQKCLGGFWKAWWPE